MINNVRPNTKTLVTYDGDCVKSTTNGITTRYETIAEAAESLGVDAADLLEWLERDHGVTVL